MKKNIVLIGFMAAGKGRTARELSERTGRYAVDCDDLIESLAKMKIRKIFELKGEEYFRNLERKTARWLEKNVRRSIISTGGGFVSVPNLANIGLIIYLYSDFDYIVKSVFEHPNARQKIKKRPLLQDLENARQLYEKRLPVYQKAADIEINATGKSTEQVALEIIKKLGLKTNLKA